MSCNECKCDYNVPIFNHFGLFRTPKKMICMLSLRVRTQSLSSLLNTIDWPSRCPVTCLILTSRLSGLKSTHHWVRDDGYLGLKKKNPPVAGTLIGNLLERRAGLRRPTVSGLNCDRRTPPWRVLYSHHVYLIWSGLSFEQEMMKNSVFWNLLSGTPKR